MPERAAQADVEALKDFAQDHDFKAIRVTIRTGGDSWQTIEVRHAGIWDDAPDGWTVAVEEHSL